MQTMLQAQVPEHKIKEGITKGKNNSIILDGRL